MVKAEATVTSTSSSSTTTINNNYNSNNNEEENTTNNNDEEVTNQYQDPNNFENLNDEDDEYENDNSNGNGHSNGDGDGVGSAWVTFGNEEFGEFTYPLRHHCITSSSLLVITSLSGVIRYASIENTTSDETVSEPDQEADFTTTGFLKQKFTQGI